MDCSLSGSSVHGIFQARVLEWVAISFSRRSFWPRDWTQVSCTVERRFTVWATREAQEVAQLCLTLCNPMNCSLSGSSVHGIFWARILEWVAISRNKCNTGNVFGVWAEQTKCKIYIYLRFFSNLWAFLRPWLGKYIKLFYTFLIIFIPLIPISLT